MRFSKQELREVRNCISLHQVMKSLKLPIKFREGYYRYSCPKCLEWNTAINPKTNLGRCFRCLENLNTIDVVMKKTGYDFKTSVQYLKYLKNEVLVCNVEK